MLENKDITGEEIYQLLIQHQENKSRIFRFFHKSELFKAITEHIQSKNCCIIVKKDPILIYRGTGHAIHFCSCRTYGNEYLEDPITRKTSVIPAPVFNMEITVGYWNEEQEKEYEVPYNFNIPIGLLKNFSKRAFNSWVKKQAEETLKEQYRQSVEEILRFLKGIPKNEQLKMLKKTAKECQTLHSRTRT